jgi:hypothetical protein
MTKLQDQSITAITGSTAIPCRSITSILTVAGLQKIGKRTLDHRRNKEVREPSITEQASITREGACQATVEVADRAH